MASTDEGRWLEGIQHPEQHDPLCPESWQPGYYLCICDRLRQAEQRGVKAAREAVKTECLSHHGYTPGQTCPYCTDALAAIDALSEDR